MFYLYIYQEHSFSFVSYLSSTHDFVLLVSVIIMYRHVLFVPYDYILSEFAYFFVHSLIFHLGNFIFINAWNEWGEGMAIEPSNLFDTSILDAINATKN